MRRRLRYLCLELKKTAGIFPRMLLQAILLMVIIGMIAFCGVKGMQKDPLAVGADIGVVVQEDNVMTRLALGYVENMESVSELCRFVQVSETEGRRMLEQGDIVALVVMPEQLVEGVMDGRNPSVDIIFPKNAQLEAMLFRELTESGAGLLRVAQAQIYGAADTAVEFGLTDELSVMEAEIDSYNLAFALDRLSIYDEETVSPTGRLSVVQHYVSSGIVLFLLLAGMAAYPVMQPGRAALRKQLARAGIGEPWQNICRWLCGLLYLLCLAGALCLLLWGLRLCAPEAAQRLSELLTGGRHRALAAGIRAGVLLAVLAAASAFHTLAYSVSQNRTGGILLIFLFSVTAVYLSGGFVPSALLPVPFRTIGDALPTAWLMRVCGSLLTGDGNGMGSCVVRLCLCTATFYATACALEYFRDRRRDGAD